MTHRPNRAALLRILVVALMLAMAAIPALPSNRAAAAGDTFTAIGYDCAPGFDLASASGSDIDANCTTAAASEPWEITDGGSNSQTATADANGIVQFQVAPGSGLAAPSADLPAAPRVYCSVYATGGSPGNYSEVATDISGVISYSINAGESVSCVWYLAVADAATGDIIIQNYACPDSVDLATATESSLFGNCWNALANASWSVLQSDSTEQYAATDSTGNVQFADVPAGEIFLSAQPGALARAFCTTFPMGDTIPDSSTEMTVTEDGLAATLDAGYTFGCYVFGTSVSTAPSQITITRLECPEGDWSASSIDDLGAICTVTPDVEFTLREAGAKYPKITDGSGSVSWSPGAGDFVLEESPVAGFASQRVFCAYDATGAGDFAQYDEMEVIDFAISGVLAGDTDMVDCLWFTFPTDTGVVTISKFACTQQFDAQTSLDTLRSSCTETPADVEFTLSDSVGDQPKATDDDGEVVWGDVASGTGSVMEMPGSGAAAVLVFCSAANAISPFATDILPVNVSKNLSIGIEIVRGTAVTCEWYNVMDAGPASLTLNVYTCPDAYDPFGQDADMYADCNGMSEQVDYSLERGDVEGPSASTGIGGMPGKVTFSDLEPGTWLLTQGVKPSIQWTFIATCESDVRTLDQLFAPMTVLSPTGQAYLSLKGGEDLSCDLFVVPPQPVGTVTVTAYTCTGTMPSADSCDIDTSGVAFGLVPAAGNAGEEIFFITDADGVATAEGAGAYELVQLDGQWCGAQSDSVDADGNVVIQEDADIQVEVFNCTG